MIPLTYLLRKAKKRYSLRERENINHLLFTDDLKLYGKSENEIKRLLPTVEVFSKDIVMEIGIKKHGVITMNRGRVKSRDAKNYQVEIYQGR